MKTSLLVFLAGFFSFSGFAPATFAQTHIPAPAPIDFTQVEISATKLNDHLYILQANGSTMQPTAMAVLIGGDGILLVDGEYAPLNPKVMAAIRAISPAAIRYVVDTHVHADHTGGNESYGKAGALIIARDNVRSRLMHPRPTAWGSLAAPAPPVALPAITFEGRMHLYIDGEDVELIPVPKAHTDGDTLVYFHTADVLLTGDFYRSIQYPNIDRINGGSLPGLLDGLALVIGLCGPNTKVVPGHGPSVGRADVVAHRDMVLGVRDRVAQLIAQGKTEEEIIAAHPTADYDAAVPKAAQRRDGFVQQVYEELAAAAQ